MKHRILIVEDEEGYRDLLQRILRRAGFEVFFAVDGIQGKELLKKTSVDLAVLDWNLPGMNGGELAAWIRKSPKLAHLPILMLTIRCKPEEEALGFASGADDYLAKPYNPMELVSRIKRLLGLPPG
ncbi:MAG: hypothetical protein A2270_02620 [Elusimicrobia bacterium RIFOXYA12_FULL_51_18]|nr:MAG: hypothetical protein A2270_02620 [Elusimicrobia bacterium RIFOXYA12_FULL_51_18]OGS31304.1 MAG: hypothetical protein A2218_08205 [Elusimicrobia bacterium RIFOXYA2_FULL_53_38]